MYELEGVNEPLATDKFLNRLLKVIAIKRGGTGYK